MEYFSNNYTIESDIINNIKEKLVSFGIDNLQENFLIKKYDNFYINKLDLHEIANKKLYSSGTSFYKDYAVKIAYIKFIDKLQTFYSYNFLPPDIKLLTVKELLKNNILKYYISEEKIYDKNEVCKIIDICTNFNNSKSKKNINTTPFYHINKDEICYLPVYLNKFVSKEVFCSGQTANRALFNGFCKIFKSYISVQSVINLISFPDIPEEEYLKDETIKKVLIHIKKLGFNIFIKDASLNGKFPVICIILISEKYKSYYASFFSHFNLIEAIKQGLSEILQYNDIENETFIKLFFKNFEKKNTPIISARVDNAILNNFIELNPSFFAKKPFYIFNKENWIFWENMYNNQNIKTLINNFISDGLNLFIRDVSFFDIPSFQIYIPELMSIFNNITLEMGINYRMDDYKCSKIIKNNINFKITEEEFCGFCKYIFNMQRFGIQKDFKNLELYYIITLIHIKQYNNALKKIKIMKNKKNFLYIKKLLNLFEDYIYMIQNKIPENKTKIYLSDKYGKHIVKRISNLFFTQKAFNNILLLMKNKKTFEKKLIMNNLSNKNNEIINNIQTKYTKNIPSQLNIKQYFI